MRTEREAEGATERRRREKRGGRSVGPGVETRDEVARVPEAEGETEVEAASPAERPGS